MNAVASLYVQAKLRPKQAAIVDGPRRLSFADLAQNVPKLAAGLLERGLKPGDRVLVFVPMSLELYQIVLACFHAGLSAVFLDAWADRRRLDAAVRLAAPKAMFGIPKAQILRLLSPGIRQIPRHYMVSSNLQRYFSKSAIAMQACKPGDEALVTFTTGSTGQPKGAPRSHEFLIAQGKALVKAFGVSRDGADLPTLPAFVLLNIGQGVTSVLPDFDPRKPADIDPWRILDQIKTERVSSSSGSPAFYEKLAQVGRIPLKRLYTGGAAVLPPLAQLLSQHCDGEVSVVYGSTEAEPIAHVTAADLIAASKAGKPGLLAGKPVGLKLKIIQAADGPLAALKVLARGKVGEIVVTGTHVQKAYLNDPQAVKNNKIKAGREIWHRTGDAGYLDKQGRLFLMGRLGSRVKRGSKEYWPLEAERRALAIPGVRFAAYFEWQGQALLCVEGDAALEPALRKALGAMPLERCLFFSKLPRDPRHQSKINMEALRAELPRRLA